MAALGTPSVQAQTGTDNSKHPQGRVVIQRGPNGVTTTTYDTQGRIQSVTAPDGKTTRQNYASPETIQESNGYDYDAPGATTSAASASTAKTSASRSSKASRKGMRANAAAARSQIPVQPQPPSALTVSEVPGIQQTGPGRFKHDFGTVNPLDTTRARQTFLVQNTGKTALTFDRVQTSCPCTTAVVGDGGKTLPTVQPGQQVPIQVTLDLTGHPAGPLTQSVFVFLPGQPRFALRMRMTGILLPVVAYSAALLDFGTVGTGETRTLPLSVTLDSRLDQDAAPPMLVSSNPDVVIGPAVQVVSPPVAPPAGKGENKPVPAKTRTLSYTLTLAKNVGVGPLRSSLYLVPSASAKLAGAAKDSSPLSSVLASATVLVTGEVTGTVSAMPQTLAFGTVRMGQPATRRIVLRGKLGGDVQNLKASTGSMYFTARLDTLAPVGSPNDAPVSRVLDVTLSGDAPPGAVQSQLKVRLANGERLLIPLSAYVSPGAGFASGNGY